MDIIDITMGLIALVVGLGLLTTVMYCLVTSYNLIADTGIFARVKNKYLRVLLTLITLIIIYALIVYISKYVGEYAIEKGKKLLYPR